MNCTEADRRNLLSFIPSKNNLFDEPHLFYSSMIYLIIIISISDRKNMSIIFSRPFGFFICYYAAVLLKKQGEISHIFWVITVDLLVQFLIATSILAIILASPLAVATTKVRLRFPEPSKKPVLVQKQLKKDYE